jgi:hypothetical protein
MGGTVIVDECTLAVNGSDRVIALILSVCFPVTKISGDTSCNKNTNFPFVLYRPTPSSLVKLWQTD